MCVTDIGDVEHTVHHGKMRGISNDRSGRVLCTPQLIAGSALVRTEVVGIEVISCGENDHIILNGQGAGSIVDRWLGPQNCTFLCIQSQERHILFIPAKISDSLNMCRMHIHNIVRD